MQQEYNYDDYMKDIDKVYKNAEDCQLIDDESQARIEQLQDIKARAKNSCETYLFIGDFYSEYDVEKFTNLSTTDLEPLQSVAGQRGNIQSWKDNMKSIFDESKTFQAIGVITSTTTSITGISLIQNVATKGQVVSKKQHDLIESYEQKINFNDDIKDIRQRLKEDFPDFLEDFNRLVTMYESSKPDGTKYFEIMAGRSAFFYKLFGSEGEIHGASTTNKAEQVRCFIVGDESKCIPEVEVLKQNAKTLWKKISKEDAPSPKKGNIDADSLKLIFGELIALAAQVLTLRKLYHYHKP